MPRKRKLENVEAPAAEVIVQAPDQTKPKTNPRAKKVETPAPAASRGRKKAEPATVPVEVIATVSEPPVTQPARSRSKKQTAAPVTEPAPIVEAPTVAPEPKPKGRVRGPKPAAAAPETPAEPVKAEKPSRGRAKAVVVAEAPVEQSAPAEPRGRRSRGGRKPEPVVAAAVVEAEAPAEADSEAAPREGRRRNRRGRGGRGRRSDTAAPATTEAVETEEAGEEDEFLPVPTWRPLAKASAKQPVKKAPAPVEDDEEIEDAPVVQWRGREKKDAKPERRERPARAEKTDKPERAERQPRERAPRAERPAPQPIVAKAEPVGPVVPPREERPKPVIKPPIFVPEDAPQVVLRDGIPTLVRNHRVYPPLFFFGNPSDERRAETVLDEVRMAADAGVHLHAYLIDLEVNDRSVEDAVAFAGFMLKKSVEADPDAQVLFRIVFHTPYGWQEKFPDGHYRSSNEPSVCDDAFWGLAAKCLEQFVRKLRLIELKDNILGVHLDRGEWFLPEEVGYDDSRAAKLKFRDWARTRYLNDEVTLRASWFDGAVRFDSIQVPPYEPEGSEGEKFVRSSRKQRKYVDYHLFLSDATVQRIGDLAYVAKAASEGYFLVGASYGYTFEWSHPSNGHLSLGKLLRMAEIDFIAGPPSYRTREPGGAAAFPGPIDSFALNGKLFISEEDFKTSLSIGHEPDDFNPRLRTPQALENVHWRGAGASLAHAAGAAWMDLWGNGWLKTPSVWERASKVQSAMLARMEAPLTDPDVAIFVDERALAYLVDPHAFELLVQNVRESVLRAGVSAAFYLLSDLAHREKFPESKLYIFLNAWDIRPDLRAAIKSRLQRDNKVLFWLYSAGLFDAGRDSLERAREVTGIALKPQPFHSKSGTTILNRRHPLSEAFPDKHLMASSQLEPSYFAIPEGATVLGEYTQTGLPSFVVKDFREGAPNMHWTSVFMGEPVVNPALIRALASMAGVHVWNFQDDVVHVRPPFCTVHCTGPGPRTVPLPSKFTAYNLITGEWAADAHNMRLNATDGSTHTLLVGPREELLHLLEVDPAKLLRIEKLPPREANVLHDASTFDVPIMKLDEWMEGGDSDEVADEWFLRAPQITEEPEQAVESEKIGRRRRKRRGGRDRNGSDSDRGDGAPVVKEFDEEIGLSVMFRKRD